MSTGEAFFLGWLWVVLVTVWVVFPLRLIRDIPIRQRLGIPPAFPEWYYLALGALAIGVLASIWVPRLITGRSTLRWSLPGIITSGIGSALYFYLWWITYGRDRWHRLKRRISDRVKALRGKLITVPA